MENSVQQCLDFAFTQLRLRRIPQAEQLCREALRLAPGNSDALNLLGMIAVILQRPDTAIAFFHKALELNSQSVTFHSNLGHALMQKGRGAEAAASLRKVTDARPDDYAAFSALAHARQVAGQDRSNQPPTSPELVAYLQKLAVSTGWPIKAEDIFAVLNADISDFSALNGLSVGHWGTDDSNRIPQPDWSCYPAEWQSFATVMEEKAQRGLVIAKDAAFYAWRNTGDHRFNVFTRTTNLVERDYQIPSSLQPIPEHNYALTYNVPDFHEVIMGIQGHGPALVIDEPAIFLNGCDVYGHFMVDIIPKLIFCSLDPSLAKLPIYCPPILGYQREMITLLGLDHLTFREISLGVGQLIEFKHGYLPGHVPYPCGVHWFRQRYAPRQAKAKRGDRRFFLSRATMTAEKRRIANEQEIQDFLLSRGFEVLLPERMSLQDVADAMAEAAIVVSSVGSTANNVIFSPPGTHLIELMSKEFLDPRYIYWTSSHPLFAYMQVQYHRILGTPAAEGQTVVDTFIHYSVEEIAAVLDRHGFTA